MMREQLLKGTVSFSLQKQKEDEPLCHGLMLHSCVQKVLKTLCVGEFENETLRLVEIKSPLKSGF